ncbi:NAD(P)-dependent alcohol dehydrogenase [Catenulispora rubra]|uniref:NAD(P)-dependent alcohol dehydrogenase n=1 Tax=Catenulispora rubra TaxID=280293 RepID=UPI0018926ED8|nr:NAD(P)-dependent alcohol dehydrogenase [Catenulispora rubra]
MKAIQLGADGGGPRLVSVAEPEPGPGQLLVRVTAAGLCRTDLKLTDSSPTALARRFRLPMTLGHEGVGVVAAVGEGADVAAGVAVDGTAAGSGSAGSASAGGTPAGSGSAGNGHAVGDAVAVYGPWGCGTCRVCVSGRENHCPRAGRLGIRPPGLGSPGSLAEYLLVDAARHAVPIGRLDPAEAAPLTDAGVTAYHAIERSLPKLGASATAVVIGAGGLGHLAIQFLRAVTGAQVVAVDAAEAKLALAAGVGAHHAVPAGRAAAREIRRLTDGIGAEAVLDFVAAEDTVALAAQCVAAGGDVTIVGTGGARIPTGFAAPAHAVAVSGTYWGTLPNLTRVIELARMGAVRAEVTRYPLEDTAAAYEELRAGRVSGRAVVCPSPS